jgi:hypothetical protein
MIDQKRHRCYGNTVGEWVYYLPAHLDDIGIGLDAIVQAGRYGFEFESAELIEFLRRSIRVLVGEGAKPLHLSSRTHFDRRVMLHYGKSTEEIVEGVIADWLAGGGGDLEWGDFCFALPGTFDIEDSEGVSPRSHSPMRKRYRRRDRRHSQWAGFRARYRLGHLMICAPEDGRSGLYRRKPYRETGEEVRVAAQFEFDRLLEQLVGPAICNDLISRDYPGQCYRTPDGMIFGVRVTRRHGLTIDIIKSNNPSIPVPLKIHQRCSTSPWVPRTY